MSQVAFLALLAAGLAGVLSGVIWTRLHWRGDVGPYREAMWVDILLHPDRFVDLASATVAKVVTRVGMLFLAGAFGVVLLEIIRSMAKG